MRFSLVKWLQNSRWSIRTKLMTGFLTISMFLLILTVLSVFIIGELGLKINQVWDAQEEVHQVTQLSEAVGSLRQGLTNSAVDMGLISARAADVNAKLITLDEAYNRYLPYLVDYDRQRTEIQRARANIQETASMIRGAKTASSYVSFFQMMNDGLQSLLNELDAIRKNASERQLVAADTGWKTISPVVDQSIERISRFSDELNTQVKTRQTASRKAVDDANDARVYAQISLSIVGFLAIVIAVGFGILLTTIFTRPVEQLRGRFVRLAEGDLSSPLHVANRDQFGDLAQTFNQSINRVGGVVERVQQQAVRVSSAAAQIAAASSHSAVVSVEQAGAVAEATVTIEELSHTAQQIAEAATLVANAAEMALNSASDGQETVRESIVGINNLKNQVRNITDRILALSERSQQVGHIIEQVASIADQTHLLALNAAIESAAAGEHGKRFSVVAASVKQLAERSRQATKDVQAVLNEIQGATNASVMATEQGMKEAERGVTLAHRTGDANESIIQMVERTVQLASAISLATQQQRSASEQVVGSMRQLATVIQDGASSAKQSSTLAAALDEIAVELRYLSSQFKVRMPNQHDSSPPTSEETSSEPNKANPPVLRTEPA